MTMTLFALAAASLGLGGYWFGRSNPTKAVPICGDQLVPVARHLLLGRHGLMKTPPQSLSQPHHFAVVGLELMRH